jgi:tetratricopeptide (TPR) repeat protein
VGGKSQEKAPGPAEAPELLALAFSRPREGLARARAVLAGRPAPLEASVAHHAAGVVLREFGDLDAAVGELRAAVRTARQAGSPAREADSRASLGVALVFAGRTSAGLAALDQAGRQASGVQAARILQRRAIVLWTLGRNPEALDDLHRAVSTLRREADTMWAGRALTARALVYLAQGRVRRAADDLGEAERLFAGTGYELESAYLVHNRAILAFRTGDLPMALSCLDEAARRYSALDVPLPDLHIDRCAVLLAAGLPRDALTQVEQAIGEFERIRGQSTKKAELLLSAATAALAAEQPQAALAWAQAARRLFRAQHRERWAALAGLLMLSARFALGGGSAPLLRAAGQLAGDLDDLGSVEAAQAHLLAGRIALRVGRTDEARRQLTAAARGRLRGPPYSRAAGWLAEALLADAVLAETLRAGTGSDSRRLLHACRRGLDLLDAHRLTLGASELRAQATAAGAELAELAQAAALRSGRPRALLRWSERWRATALAVPPVRPGDDQELAADLAAARDVASRLAQAQDRGRPVAALRQQQRRLEDAVRARAMRAPGAPGAPGPQDLDPGALLGELNGTRLVQIVSTGTALHVLVCADGQVRHRAAGQAAQALRATELARSGLRRLAHSGPGRGPSADSAFALLAATGRQLEQTLLGDAVHLLGDGPVVIVPPGRFHAIPWALLPSLRYREVSVAPSAHAWLRARAARPPDRRRVVLARGPGLITEGAEVPELAPMYDDVTVLADAGASSKRLLAALDGAWLGHVAAHGTFRADSPLFSSLRMADGPLTVYDFERLRCAPHLLILPSCDSGRLAPAGADELLGLTSSMLPLGTAGVVASVAPLNDAAAVPLMLSLHQHLHSGQTLAGSLCAIRRQVSDDPVLLGAAWSLVALGAG